MWGFLRQPMWCFQNSSLCSKRSLYPDIFGYGGFRSSYETCFVISSLINHKTGSAFRRCLRVSTNPSSASSKTGVCSGKWENERYNTGKTVRICIPPYPFCILFQIHGSKFKLHPVRYLSQACVSSISQTMLLLCIRKDTFNRLFPSLVHPLADRSVTGIVGQFFVVFPDVSGNCFHAVLALCT